MNSTHYLHGATLERIALVKPTEDTTMLTTEEVAGIFNVHPGTVIRWRSQGMLQSEDMDFNWRRAGRRYTIAAVAEFAEKMGKKDGGRTPARFERWYSSKSA